MLEIRVVHRYADGRFCDLCFGSFMVMKFSKKERPIVLTVVITVSFKGCRTTGAHRKLVLFTSVYAAGSVTFALHFPFGALRAVRGADRRGPLF